MPKTTYLTEAGTISPRDWRRLPVVVHRDPSSSTSHRSARARGYLATGELATPRLTFRFTISPQGSKVPR
jgi:hypothetical protein